MKDVNKVILIGRLGAKPVQRETKNGVPVVHFPLATSRKIVSSEEGVEPAEETQWHRIVAWGKQGENCAKYLEKGSPVFVEGTMRSHKYEGKDGMTRMAFEVHADEVNFLGGGRRRLEDGAAMAESVAAESVAV